VNKPFKALQSEIDHELDKLKKLVQEQNSIENEYDSSPDSTIVRALASITHDFYTGIEQIFETIALEMEGTLPEGDQWHRRLLARMASDIDDIRPAVISESLEETLDEYLRFRHVFRHSYGFELQWNKCRHLVEDLDSTLETFTQELTDFKAFLDDLDNSL
jgi:hypothetical protein